MSEVGAALIGAAVVTFFVWRFIRTHNLYRYSLGVLKGLEEPTQVRPSISKEFF